METKSFFSNDVIQRITSGNEPQLTKISLDVLKNVLKPKQMRNVLGGSGGTCGSSGNRDHYSEMCWEPLCGLTIDDAKARQSACGGTWCCDSCGSAGYC